MCSYIIKYRCVWYNNLKRLASEYLKKRIAPKKYSQDKQLIINEYIKYALRVFMS